MAHATQAAHVIEADTKIAPQISATSDITSAPAYQGTGGSVHRFVTPGGHPVDNSQPAFPVYHRRFGNPSPLGLFSFSITTLLMSLYNLHTRGVYHANAMLGMTIGYAGIAQLLAGIQEWACGNTFAATTFASYGGFWFSYSFLYIPQFEIAAAYSSEAEFANAVGLMLIAWGVLTVLFAICAHRSSVALLSLLINLVITFFCLGAGTMTGSANVEKAGNVFGIITGCIGFYTAMAGVLTPDTSFFTLPVGDLSH